METNKRLDQMAAERQAKEDKDVMNHGSEAAQVMAKRRNLIAGGLSPADADRAMGAAATTADVAKPVVPQTAAANPAPAPNPSLFPNKVRGADDRLVEASAYKPPTVASITPKPKINMSGTPADALAAQARVASRTPAPAAAPSPTPAAPSTKNALLGADYLKAQRDKIYPELSDKNIARASSNAAMVASDIAQDPEAT